MRIVSTHGHGEVDERPDRHETIATSTRALWLFIAGMAMFIALSAFGLAGLYRWFAASPGTPEPATPLVPERQQPPPPRLQTSPHRDIESFRAAEDRALSSYGWVDRNLGVVRIPIDRAIDIVAQRGLPARAPGETSVPTVPATGAPSRARRTGPPSGVQP
jgi:hypothetical protein